MGAERIALAIEACDADFVGLACTVEERLSAPFHCRITCEVRQGGASVHAAGLDLIGRRARVVLRAADVERVFAGLVERVEDIEGHSVITVAPPVAGLGDTRDYRVFVDRSATEVVAEVLAAHGIAVDLCARREAPRRSQWVQNFESDLSFCDRLLAGEGMSWTPVPSDPARIRVADEPGTFLDPDLSLPYREEAGLDVGRALFAGSLARRAQSDAVALRDHDFEHPQLDLAARRGGPGAREWYEFPGGFRDPDEGAAIAKMRLGERQREAAQLFGEATCPELSAGVVFTVRDAPMAAMNGRYLVIAAEHVVETRAGAEDITYRVRFRAVPEEPGYRPPRRSPPLCGGAGTAIATSPRGQEISIDTFGRTRLLMREDRRHEADEHASAPARVVQPQLAAAAFHPRAGWEQLVAFTDRAAEAPLVLGRLYNGEQTPPAALPGGKVETHLGTRSTPNGTGGSGVRIDDTAGREALLLEAFHDYQELVEQDRVEAVVADAKRAIAGERKLVVEENLVSTVEGGYALTIGGSREAKTDGDGSVQAAQEVVLVGGARLFSVAGDHATKAPSLFRFVTAGKVEAALEHQSVHTVGPSAVLVGGALVNAAAMHESVTVGGAAVVKVGGLQSIRCAAYRLDVKGGYAESYATYTAQAGGKVNELYGTLTHEVAGGAKLEGATVAVEATAELVIRAGGVTIRMTPGAIDVEGDVTGAVAGVEQGRARYG
jgi:type VI secretion system secreted protein VgrG